MCAPSVNEEGMHVHQQPVAATLAPAAGSPPTSARYFPPHRPDIDGLRTLAVLCVVLFHLDEVAGVSILCPGGFAGVDVFFVISGYVVAGSLLRRKCDGTVGKYLAMFYTRRMQRLTPALALVVSVTAVLMAVLYPEDDPDDFPSAMLGEFYASGAIGLVGGANIYYAYGITTKITPSPTATQPSSLPLDQGAVNQGAVNQGVANYFGRALDSNPETPTTFGFTSGCGRAHGLTGWRHDLSRNPFLHFWSLAVEEQFYFVFPLLMVLAYGRIVCSGAPEWRVLRIIGPPEWRPFTLFSLTLGPTFAICWWATRAEPNYAFYMMPSRLWQLAIGAVLLHCQTIGMPELFAQLLHRHLVVALLDAISIVLLVVAFAASNPSDGNFPLPWSLTAIIGTLAFLAAGSAPSHGPSQAPVARASATSEPVINTKAKVVIEIMPTTVEIVDKTGENEGRQLSPKLSECQKVSTKAQQYSFRLPWPPTYRGPLGNKLLATPPLPYLGRLSYPIYLWHWPMIVLFKWHFSIDRPEIKFALFSLSLVLAALTHHLVEKPVQQGTRKWQPRWIALTGLSTIALVAVMLGLLSLLHRPPHQNLLSEPPDILACNASVPDQNGVSWSCNASRAMRDAVFPSRACRCLACFRGLPEGAAANISGANISGANVSAGAPTVSASTGSALSTGSCDCPLKSPVHALHPGSTSSQAWPVSSTPLMPCFVPIDSSLDKESNGIYSDIPLVYTDHCWQMAGPMHCLGSSRPAPPLPQRRLFVLGDSHAAMLLQGLHAVFARVHFDVVSWAEIIDFDMWLRPHSKSEVWAALEARVQPKDVVLFCRRILYWWMNTPTFGNSIYGTGDFSREPLQPNFVPHGDGLKAIQLANHLLRNLFLEVLAPRGATLVILDDVFSAPEQPWTCFRRGGPCLYDATYAGNLFMQEVLRNAMRTLVTNVTNSTAQSANVTTSVLFLPVLFESFCIAGVCDLRVPGTETIGFFDDDHLNTAGSLYVGPFIACAFEQAGLLSVS